MVTPEMALALGMVNRVEAFDTTIARLMDTRTEKQQRQASLRTHLAIADAWNPGLDA